MTFIDTGDPSEHLRQRREFIFQRANNSSLQNLGKY